MLGTVLISASVYSAVVTVLNDIPPVQSYIGAEHSSSLPMVNTGERLSSLSKEIPNV